MKILKQILLYTLLLPTLRPATTNAVPVTLPWAGEVTVNKMSNQRSLTVPTTTPLTLRQYSNYQRLKNGEHALTASSTDVIIRHEATNYPITAVLLTNAVAYIYYYPDIVSIFPAYAIYLQETNTLTLTVCYNPDEPYPLLQYVEGSTPVSTYLHNELIADIPQLAQYFEEIPGNPTREHNADKHYITTSWKLLPDADIPDWVEIALSVPDAHHLPVPIGERVCVTKIDSPAELPGKPIMPENSTESSQTEITACDSGPKSKSAIVPSLRRGLPMVYNGWYTKDRCDQSKVMVMVMPLTPDCEVAFVGRAFETIGGTTHVLDEIRTEWSLQKLPIHEKAAIRASNRDERTFSILGTTQKSRLERANNRISA
ncbi:MAG: hypothetical protein LBJ95_00545 [Oscillospiraceae bacterium]|jgi:hypothetical protein|nr:hypothetical protein [Oscillospiraceae bacterium]